MISTEPHSSRGMPPEATPKAAINLPENEVIFRELFECAPVAYHETDAAGSALQKRAARDVESVCAIERQKFVVVAVHAGAMSIK